MHLVFTGAHGDVAAQSVVHIDRPGFFQEPDPHLEPEIGRSQGAHRADVHGVERVVAVERPLRMTCNRGETAPIHKTEDIVLGYLLHKPDASRAQHAALRVQSHPRPQFHVLGFLHLPLQEPGLALAVLHGELLKPALTCLIANWAVERMVDQQKLHHALAAFAHHRRIRPHAHPLGHLLRTGNLRPWNPCDLRLAVRAQNRLPVWRHFRHPDFHQTHPAVARGAELGVVAVPGHKLLGLRAGFNDFGAFGELEPSAVDLDVDHRDGRCSAHRV